MEVEVAVLVPYDPISEFELFLLPKYGSQEILWFGVFINKLRSSSIQKNEVKIQFEVNNSWFGKSVKLRS